MDNIFRGFVFKVKAFLSNPKTREVLKKILWAAIDILIEVTRPEDDDDKGKPKPS